MPVVSTHVTERGIVGEMIERFKATPTYFRDLSTELKSQAASEDYAILGQTPRMREWGTGRLAKGLRSEKYTVENYEYECTLEIDRKELEDAQISALGLRIQELAAHAATHPDWLLAQLLINGATAGYLSYDGVTFFNDTHESGASGEQDNKLTYDATDHTAVTTDEFKLACAQAIQQMMGFKDDTGDTMRIGPTGMNVIVPASLYWVALEALNATMIAQTSNILAGAARVIPLPDLTDGAVFYLLKTDVPVRPLIFQNRMPVEFQALLDSSPDWFTKNKGYAGCRGRYRLTYGYWQYAIRMEFT